MARPGFELPTLCLEIHYLGLTDGFKVLKESYSDGFSSTVMRLTVFLFN